MNVSEYNYLVNNPEAITARQTQDLERVIQDFPYFQSARALSLKGLYNQNSFKYNYALKITAAHTADRSVLFGFITSDDFTTINHDPHDQKLSGLWEMPVNNLESVSAQNPVDDNTFAASDETSTEMAPVPEPENFQAILSEAQILKIDSPLTGLEPESVANNVDETLDIGKPLNFNSAETHSFAEWLQLSKFDPIDRSGDQPLEQLPEPNTEKQKKNEMIDRFIETNPKIPKIKAVAAAESVFIFEPSQTDSSMLMTETLAKVYLEQKKYKKAIQAYEILILKYPEKSTFFADRISDIRDLQQSNNLQ